MICQCQIQMLMQKKIEKLNQLNSNVENFTVEAFAIYLDKEDERHDFYYQVVIGLRDGEVHLIGRRNEKERCGKKSCKKSSKEKSQIQN